VGEGASHWRIIKSINLPFWLKCLQGLNQTTSATAGIKNAGLSIDQLSQWQQHAPIKSIKIPH
jgi:hypothetical protein